ncbi:ATPase, V1/A1 complex, subunit E [Annulohypoxylon maeteangense]|uniref:ATPase, V1/A1 complex, subunit E n=1 Tax=Annulohypoxylon maeteangense TaxID=1927788 RepID=UPI002007C6F2|nr:ATPase, V1/A1 complex, subunit E [Annulohypoxylon maeteangense]KAI0883777.1 ATPase, V1/A1 complex, subunit E [Annulohypoxylon maeteangense]
MSQVHALSDDQVGQELRKMTAFIKQEALEKAREIEIKANEEFSIEKSKLVRQETDAIDAAHAKKLKQAAMSQQITRSTVANKTRLKVLAARQQLLDDIFEAASKRLAEGTKDAAKYRVTLKNLLLEGLYALTESEIQVRARKADYAVVNDAIKDAEEEYKKTTGKTTKVTIDEEDPLPEGSSGGLVIVGFQGKIDINNTFDERLLLLQSSGLPAVRETLFGKNPNRKFYD